MLTKTLRALERDGLLLRHETDEKPLRVEYELTAWGGIAAAHVTDLDLGGGARGGLPPRARHAFDRQTEAGENIHRSW
jgi:DNA-binding PadR family transcriptional regulator